MADPTSKERARQIIREIESDNDMELSDLTDAEIDAGWQATMAPLVRALDEHAAAAVKAALARFRPHPMPTESADDPDPLF